MSLYEYTEYDHKDSLTCVSANRPCIATTARVYMSALAAPADGIVDHGDLNLPPR